MRYDRVVLYRCKCTWLSRAAERRIKSYIPVKVEKILVKIENTLEVVELYLVLLYVLLYIRVHQCTAVQQPSVDHHKFKI